MKKLSIYLLSGLTLCFCVVALFLGIQLKRGITLEAFIVSGVHVSNVSLQWKKKLQLEVEQITVDSREGGEDFPKDFSLVDDGIRVAMLGSKIFSSITIGKILFEDMEASLYLNKHNSFFTLTGRDLEIQSTMSIDQDTVLIDVTHAVSKKYDSHLSGTIRINGKTDKADGDFAVVLAGGIPLHLEFSADPRQMYFHGKESGEITNITPFVDLFGMKPSDQKWITEYLKGSRYELKTFTGSFPWNDASAVFDRFYAKAKVIDPEYVFAPGFEAVKAKSADVVFQKGVLSIRPHDATFYGQETEDSWLDIDFNDYYNWLLTLHLKTHASVNQDIIDLVANYGIPLPFVQTAGTTAADLILTVNLDTEQVTAVGAFEVDEGRVDFNKQEYGLRNSIIKLKDTVVTFQDLNVKFGDMYNASIKGSFDASTEVGDLYISLQSASLPIGESFLTLENSKSHPSLHYKMAPKKSMVTGSKSSWKIDSISVEFAAFTSSFSLDDYSGELAATAISFPPGVSGRISGKYSIEELSFDLKCDLLQYKAKGLQLTDKSWPLRVRFNNDLIIKSEHKSTWLLSEVPVVLYPSEFKFSSNVYSITKGRLYYGEIFSSEITGYYNHKTNKGELQLEQLNIEKKDIGNIITVGKAISVVIDGKDDGLLLAIPHFAMEFSSDHKNSWSLALNDLSVLNVYSPLLQKYMVDKGKINVVSKEDGKEYHFTAEIPYRYALLATSGGTPITRYAAHGIVKGDTVSATINENIQLHYEKNIHINSKGFFLNVPGVVKFIEGLPDVVAEEKGVENSLQLYVDAVDSGVMITPDRKLLADSITVTYGADKIAAILKYKQGTMSVDLEGESFSLSGQGFNDVFVDALIPGSDFDKGTLEMAAKGTFDKFSAVVKIKNTVMREFVTLNNILAMVNTIPALITFSLPSYNLMGLPVDSLVVGVTVENGIGTFDTLDLESPEISMAGKGWVDFLNSRVDMDLNLITGAKKSMSKIPLLGYIFAGKEKHPSITVKVSGDLNDPKVEDSTFKDVVTTPFAILYRTLALPAHLVSPLFDLDDEPDDGKKTGVEQ